MKNLCVLIMITLFSWTANAQKSISYQKNYPIDTSSILKERTQSLICTILMDSTFLRENYVINQYYSPVTWYDVIKPKIKKNKRKNRTRNITIDTVLCDPFEIDGCIFDVKRSIDTNKLAIRCAVQNKIIIDSSQVRGKFALSIQEPPVFSKDYMKALIVVIVNCDGGGTGDQLFYVLENSIWRRVSTKSLWRI